MTATRNAMRTARLRQGFVSALILIIALIGYGMVRYPLIVSEAGVSSIFLPVFMLLLYGVAAVWFTHRPGQAHVAALRTGTAYGLVVGVTFIITISVENFVDIIGQVGTISTLGFMLLIFLLFALAGRRGGKDSGQLRWGIFASVWSAMIGVLIALLFGFAINFLFAPRLEQNLQASAEYVRSGSHDLATFTFWNTLESASSHLLEAPVIAAIFGSLGSLIGLAT
jgi:hypothetical protein